VLRPGRQPGERRAQRLDHAGHQAERGADERIQLLVTLVGVSEEPGQHLQQRLVAEREQLGDLAGRRRGDQRLRGGGHEPCRVRPFHPLGALQVQEMGQRRLAERQQVQLHARREVVGTLREVRPGEPKTLPLRE
jgi:hypothetical protein